MQERSAVPVAEAHGGGRDRRRLLIVTYHYPPVRGSTGFLRALGFAKYLGDAGWESEILTVSPRAYPDVDEQNMALAPADVRVHRAPAWDIQRHLSVRGRYPAWMALPDRWQSWIPFAVVSGVRRHLEARFDAVLATFPIASAIVVGVLLARAVRRPLVLDFRDPMGQPEFPSDRRQRWCYHRLERWAVRRAAAITVTTPGAAAQYAERYPEVADRVHTIENGFDEALFPPLSTVSREPGGGDGKVILHSGVLYPGDRDPTALFDAIASLMRARPSLVSGIEFRLRASGSEAHYRRLVDERGIGQLVTFAEPTSYRSAVEEMRGVDGLMLIQGDGCNRQIPAKAYEYLATGRPILVLAHPDGDTWRLLAGLGVPYLARLDSATDIERVLTDYLVALRSGAGFVVKREQAARYTRCAGARRLAEILDRVMRQGGVAAPSAQELKS